MNNKDKLVEYSALLMSQDGYLSVSLDKLIETTGISKSNFYYHYQSKEMLGLDVLTYWINAFLKLDEISLNNAKLLPRNRLEQYFNRLIGFQKDNDCCGNPCWLLASEIVPNEATTIYQHFVIKHRQNMQNCIADGQKVGVISPKLDASSTAFLMLQTILGAEMDCRTEKSTLPLNTVTRLLSDFILT